MTLNSWCAGRFCGVGALSARVGDDLRSNMPPPVRVPSNDNPAFLEAGHPQKGRKVTHNIRMNGTKWVLFGLSFVLFAYAAIRAHTVSFSYDESYTFLQHVRKGMFYQQAYDQMGGNHHLLNVWGMWVSMKLFGNGEFALRLPNLLAYVLYLYATARIELQAQWAFNAIVCFVLLNVHPNLFAMRDAELWVLR